MDNLLDNAPCGFISLTNEGVIVAVNATLLELLGYQLDELSGQRLETILPLPSRLLFQSFFLPLLSAHGRAEELFFSLVSKNGREEPMLVNAIRRERQGLIVDDCILMPMRRRSLYEDEILRARKDAENAARLKIQAVISLEETQASLMARQAELLEANARLEALSTLDHLTGLKNRRAFQDYLVFQMAFTNRVPSQLSMLMIDVDYFKNINDTYGHPMGDKYLQMLSELLRENLREFDMAARYGGEEFAVVLPNTDKATAMLIAERLRLSIASAAWPELGITVSLGVATLEPAINSETAFIFLADQALYASKEQGRNRVTHAADLRASSAVRRTLFI